MSVLVSDIALRVKRQFGDEDGAQITDNDIIRWVNDAQRQICLSNDVSQVVAVTNGVINQQAYAMPANVARLHRVMYEGIALQPISMQEADELISSHDQTIAQGYPTGTPTHYWVWANQINLYPAPDNTGVNDLRIYGFGFSTDVTAVNQPITVPQEYWNAIVAYCVAQAFELDSNIQVSTAKMGQFDKSLSLLKDQDESPGQNVYPHITVSMDDAGYGDVSLVWGS